MMCCGQVPPLVRAADFANILTLRITRALTIRSDLSLLYTCCGLAFESVDGLWPNPEWNRYGNSTDYPANFVP